MMKANRRKPLEGTRETGSFRRILTFGGALVAFQIGSGFATGQEVMQYFSSYGLKGIIGTSLVVFILLSYVAVELLVGGRSHSYSKPSSVFYHFGGKYLGLFYDYFSILLAFLTFTVMVSGAGAVFEQHYGLSRYAGGAAITILVAATVWFGLKRLTDIIGKIGPVIAVVGIVLGIYGIARNPAGLGTGIDVVADLEMTRASVNWFMAGLSYVGLAVVLLSAFLTALGSTTRSRNEAIGGGVLGAGIFTSVCAILGLALLANISDVFDAQIPILVIARNLGPVVASLLSLMIALGIYTTAVPVLWTVSSRFFPDGSRRFKYLTIALAVVGMFIGLLLPFDQMVNLVYVLNGYVGIGFIGLILLRRILIIFSRSTGQTPILSSSPNVKK